jgi:hypothetical protein
MVKRRDDCRDDRHDARRFYRYGDGGEWLHGGGYGVDFSKYYAADGRNHEPNGVK